MSHHSSSATRFRGRFGLLIQLLAGFAAGGLFLVVLLLVGDSMLQHTSQRLVTMLEEHVHPLARLHQLQSRIAALRNLELELSTLRDIFVIQQQVTKISAEVEALDGEMREFSNHLISSAPDEAIRLLGHWQEYRSRLLEQMRLADAMDMAAVEKITVSGSRLPFSAIQDLLGEVAANTKVTAERAYEDTVARQADQRRAFLMLVLLGSSLIFVGLAYSGRVVVRRIRILHDHAQKLAAGEDSGAIVIGNYDEIGELATAFTSMRAQVLQRESALRAAQLELEDRVEARTRALSQANGQLVLFSQVVSQNPVGILIATMDGEVEYANAAYGIITGQPVEAVVGQSLAAAVKGGDSVDMAKAISTAMGNDRWEAERRGVRANGEMYWERLHLAVVQDQDGKPAHLSLSREDITERHAQQEKIAYQAHYDALTGLPNRVLAVDRLAQSMEHCRRVACRSTAMCIDLDNFKQINDTLGHAAGDELLRQAAARLKIVIRAADTVARLGGDEFLVIVTGLTHGDEANAIAEKINSAFAIPFQVEGRELVISPSIGISFYPDDGEDPTTLLRNADMAMYKAKEDGRNTYRFFNEAMNADALERLNLLSQLRGAVDRRELVLFYQPQVELKTGRITGAEALIRWRHPDLGLVPPGRFIPIAEESGLIIPIGTWVLQEACRQAVAWQQAGFPPLVVAVNVSVLQFRAPEFHQTVVAALKSSGLDPSCLELEFTESILIRDTEAMVEKARQLRELGVKLSIDDFGTGYSSLSYLKRFPVDKLKIDQSFVRDMAADLEDAALVHAIIHMAKSLGLKTIAEGVETDTVLEHLCGSHCDEAQGYFLGRPMPVEDFKTYLEERKSLAEVRIPIPQARLTRIA